MCSGGGALLCNVTKKSPLLNSVRRKLYVFLTAIFLSLSCFGEIPHSYVTDNPNAQVNKIETIKEREKAELNLSVTKVKSKELSGQIDESNKRIILTLPEEFHNKSLVVVEGLEELPNPSTVQGRKVLSRILNNKAVSSNLTQEVKDDKLIVNYENQPEKLYVSDLNGNFYKWNNIQNNYLKIQSRYGYQGESIIEIDDTYNGEWINFRNGGKFVITNNPKGIKLISTYGSINLGSGICGVTFSNKHTLKSHSINGIGLGDWDTYDYHPGRYASYEFSLSRVNISNDLIVEYQAIKLQPQIRIVKIPKKDFEIKYYLRIEHIERGDHGASSTSYIITDHIFKFKYVVRTLEGQSVLTTKEYYPVNQFMEFNSTTMEEGSPLALENSLRDVSLTTSGKGIVTMEQGDKLEIDGKQVVIGAGGNLAEQKATIGNLEYTYKVENGKLRLALNKWGVLEPDRDLMIRVWRTKDGAESKLVEHTLTVKAPRRVEGSSDLTYDNDYQIRTFVRFGGISLTAPGISSLETPVPAGVALSSQAGQGIPFMNEGDILEVNDGVTRAVHQFTIGANGTLGKKQIKFNNSDVTLYVENGKLRAGLNNWIVNKPVKLNLRLIRGTNEIMNHAIGFKVPEAPFNIKENGLLDFGRVTAGSKRTAETRIVLEMLNDVDSVKFNLKDTQPVMENANGKQLQVNEIQTIVKKQGERTYLVKLHGKLIIPEDTQMGEYSGSTILELRIK